MSVFIHILVTCITQVKKAQVEGGHHNERRDFCSARRKLVKDSSKKSLYACDEAKLMENREI